MLEGRHIGPEDIQNLMECNPVMADLAGFLDEWFSESPTLQVQTSGSTGTPKRMLVQKTSMEASARMTCSFLNLKAGDTALLCMPLKYIGAKMMVVRAITHGLNLYCVKPSSHPLQNLDFSPDFIAMTPAQTYSSLEAPGEAALLRQTEHLIIGGGAVSAGLEDRLCSFPKHVWSTYGMTETLSHIALRQLNGIHRSEEYTPFKGIQLSLSPDSTLVIHAPALSDKEIHTNDIAELYPNGTFRILGRKDNIVNSGGVKIQIESVESQLLPFLPFDFQITAAPDDRYGETVVLLAKAVPEKNTFEALEMAFAKLHMYSRPKRTFFVQELPVTESGKPNRAKARELAKKFLKDNHV